MVYSGGVKERFADTDIVISCGDLKPYYYDFIVSSLNVPFYYVLGNHSVFSAKPFGENVVAPWNEEEERPKHFVGGKMLEGKVLYLKDFDLILAGLGGSRRYNRGDNQYSEREMAFRIAMMIPRLLWNRLVHGRYLDCFITHASPRWT